MSYKPTEEAAAMAIAGLDDMTPFHPPARKGRPPGIPQPKPIHQVRSEGKVKRLALRPERIPGIAPPCEDDTLGPQGGRYSRPVTLPKLSFLEEKD